MIRMEGREVYGEKKIRKQTDNNKSITNKIQSYEDASEDENVGEEILYNKIENEEKVGHYTDTEYDEEMHIKNNINSISNENLSPSYSKLSYIHPFPPLSHPSFFPPSPLAISDFYSFSLSKSRHNGSSKYTTTEENKQERDEMEKEVERKCDCTRMCDEKKISLVMDVSSKSHSRISSISTASSRSSVHLSDGYMSGCFNFEDSLSFSTNGGGVLGGKTIMTEEEKEKYVKNEEEDIWMHVFNKKHDINETEVYDGKKSIIVNNCYTNYGSNICNNNDKISKNEKMFLNNIMEKEKHSSSCEYNSILSFYNNCKVSTKNELFDITKDKEEKKEKYQKGIKNITDFADVCGDECIFVSKDDVTYNYVKNDGRKEAIEQNINIIINDKENEENSNGNKVYLLNLTSTSSSAISCLNVENINSNNAVIFKELASSAHSFSCVSSNCSHSGTPFLSLSTINSSNAALKRDISTSPSISFSVSDTLSYEMSSCPSSPLCFPGEWHDEKHKRNFDATSLSTSPVVVSETTPFFYEENDDFYQGTGIEEEKLTTIVLLHNNDDTDNKKEKDVGKKNKDEENDKKENEREAEESILSINKNTDVVSFLSSNRSLHHSYKPELKMKILLIGRIEVDALKHKEEEDKQNKKVDNKNLQSFFISSASQVFSDTAVSYSLENTSNSSFIYSKIDHQSTFNSYLSSSVSESLLTHHMLSSASSLLPDSPPPTAIGAINDENEEVNTKSINYINNNKNIINVHTKETSYNNINLYYNLSNSKNNSGASSSYSSLSTTSSLSPASFVASYSSSSLSLSTTSRLPPYRLVSSSCTPPPCLSSAYYPSANLRIRRDSRGRVIRRGSKRHSICFVDEATNNKTGLREIFEVESYKDVYNSQSSYYKKKKFCNGCIIM